MKSKIIKLALGALLLTTVSACSERFGLENDDPALAIPFQSPFMYMNDSRYRAPNKTRIPDTLPAGVYKSRFED